MIYTYTSSKISGVYLFNIPVFEDHRGSIAKTFHKPSFMELGLECDFGESLITQNYEEGVVRGFHFQRPPFAQAKTIYCVSGAILDAVLDLRTGSPTYGETQVFALSGAQHNMLYIPQGVANCYAIQQKDTIIAYNLTAQYSPSHDGGVRWDSLGLDLGIKNPVVSEKDRALPAWDAFISPF